MNIVDVLQSGHGSGLARLARASLALDPSDVDLVDAARAALAPLFKRDTPTRAQELALALHRLRSMGARKRAVGDEMVVDFLAAACLARMQRTEEAVPVIEGWRELLRPLISDLRDRAVKLSFDADIEGRAHAALLQEEAFELEVAFDVIAEDVLGLSVPAKPVVAKSAELVRTKTPHPSSTHKPLVLIVDDDEDVRLMFGVFLEENGFATAEAENGARAIDRLERGLRPDLILLDLMMPVMSGWDFHKWQLQQPSMPPTIVFTATGLRPGALGPLPILSKTVEPNTLLAEVRRCATSVAA
jgi:two-component system chemotaxis response regulator CheY